MSDLVEHLNQLPGTQAYAIDPIYLHLGDSYEEFIENARGVGAIPFSIREAHMLAGLDEEASLKNSYHGLRASIRNQLLGKKSPKYIGILSGDPPPFLEESIDLVLDNISTGLATTDIDEVVKSILNIVSILARTGEYRLSMYNLFVEPHTNFIRVFSDVSKVMPQLKFFLLLNKTVGANYQLSQHAVVITKDGHIPHLPTDGGSESAELLFNQGSLSFIKQEDEIKIINNAEAEEEIGQAFSN